jgi:hypothetical protein
MGVGYRNKVKGVDVERLLKAIYLHNNDVLVSGEYQALPDGLAGVVVEFAVHGVWLLGGMGIGLYGSIECEDSFIAVLLFCVVVRGHFSLDRRTWSNLRAFLFS